MGWIYTRTGDQGETGLLGKVRVPKYSLLVEVNGTLDEAGAALALARALGRDPWAAGVVERIQKELQMVCTEVASVPGEGSTPKKETITGSHVKALERDIDYVEELLPPIRRFVIPGSSPGEAAMHLARTVVRRAERLAVRLASEEAVRSDLLAYLNRLSDLLFVLARMEEFQSLVKLIKSRVKMRLYEMSSGTTGNGFLQMDEGSEREVDTMSDSILLEAARKLIAAAEVKASEIGVPMVVAVVDGGGSLAALERMDGALLASIDIAINKAYTAVALKMESGQLGEVSGPGQPLFGINTTNQGRIVIFGGGFPLVADGQVVGGIGVSGGSVEEDEAVGRFALKTWKPFTP